MFIIPINLFKLQISSIFMKNPTRNLLNICIRYIILLLIVIAFYYSQTLYNLLFILTIYPVNFGVSLFYPSLVSGSFILINQLPINIIPACVAISAYVLLLILNLTTPMGLKKRFYTLIFSLFALLLLNITRIIILIILLMNSTSNFEFIHKIFWYGLSIIFVILIWFLTTYLFKIRNIPIYTDIKQLIKTKR